MCESVYTLPDGTQTKNADEAAIGWMGRAKYLELGVVEGVKRMREDFRRIGHNELLERCTLILHPTFDARRNLIEIRECSTHGRALHVATEEPSPTSWEPSSGWVCFECREDDGFEVRS